MAYNRTRSDDIHASFRSAERMEKAQRFEAQATRTLAQFGLSFTIEKFDWQRDRYAKFAVVTPAANVPKEVVRRCVAPVGEKALFGQGFRSIPRKAYCFNIASAFPGFLTALGEYATAQLELKPHEN